MIKRKVHILVTVFLAAFLAYGAINVLAQGSDSNNDIIPSVEYVDAQVSLLMQEIESLREEIAALKETEGTGGGALFEVLTLSAGQRLIAGEGTEIVLRGGAGGGFATAISGVNGDGLADVTAGQGKDLKTGDRIPLNHLLIVSRDDGRGIQVENIENSKVYLLVKGPYRIE